MRNDGFLLRQLESPLLQERFDERFHLMFQKFFGDTCHDEVIGIPCQVDLRAVPLR